MKKSLVLLVTLFFSIFSMAMEENEDGSKDSNAQSQNVEVDSNQLNNSVGMKRKLDDLENIDESQRLSKRQRILTEENENPEEEIKNARVKSLRQLSAKVVANYSAEHSDFEFENQLPAEIIEIIKRNLYQNHSSKAWVKGNLTFKPFDKPNEYGTVLIDMSDTGDFIALLRRKDVKNVSNKNKNHLIFMSPLKSSSLFFPTSIEDVDIEQALISRDGRYIVIGYSSGRTLIHDNFKNSQRFLKVKKIDNSVPETENLSLALSRDSKLLVIGYSSNGYIELVNLETGKILACDPSTTHNCICEIKISKNNKFIILNYPEYALMIDVTGKTLGRYDHGGTEWEDRAPSLKLSNNEEYTLFDASNIDDDYFEIWKTQNFTQLYRLENHDVMALSSDNKFVVTAPSGLFPEGGKARQMVIKRHFETGVPYQVLDFIVNDQNRAANYSDKIKELKITKNNKYVMSLTKEGNLRIIDFAKATREKTLDNICNFAISSDDKVMVALDRQKNALIFYDLEALKLIREVEIPACSANKPWTDLYISRDNRVIFVANDSDGVLIFEKIIN